MLRSVAGFVLLAGLSPASAAILPDTIEGATKGPVRKVTLQDPALWQEYGIEETEQAVYDGPGKKFTVAAYRLKDPTAAMAVYQWLRPAGWNTSPVGENAAESERGLWMAFGNYCLRVDGIKLAPQAVGSVVGAFPRLDQSSLPTLPGVLPTEALIPATERFITGPESLAHFLPQLKPSLVAFSYGTEGQMAQYRTGASESTLVVFSYPTPHIARERLEEFRKVPYLTVKRAGPLIAVVVEPKDADAAERLLAKVNYSAAVTWMEQSNERKLVNLARFFLNLFLFVAILGAFCLVAGVAVGGFRVFWRRRFRRDEEEAMVVLDLHSDPQR